MILDDPALRLIVRQLAYLFRVGEFNSPSGVVAAGLFGAMGGIMALIFKLLH
ncbi:hypothetical protein [Pseudomonas sp. GL-B-26]|uniref:hypothetical protein n=1 Tax=Pseudomonas sp. GL-B-26 TaxID=2832394 RepID=UPI001CBB9CA4|nr:hypothetical protein [Pseudomonas sp. GL-B-26]